MRRIESKEELEKKQNRNKALFSYIVLGILIVSSVGYAFLSGSGQTSEKTPTSGESGGRYYTTISGQQLFFSNSPENVKNISANIFLNINSYSGKPIYIASNNSEISYEIASTLGLYTERAQKACYQTCGENLPEKTCDDNLIVWTLSNESNIHQEKNCVFISGDIKAVDAFLFKVFGLS